MSREYNVSHDELMHVWDRTHATKNICYWDKIDFTVILTTCSACGLHVPEKLQVNKSVFFIYTPNTVYIYLINCSVATGWTDKQCLSVQMQGLITMYNTLKCNSA